MGGCPSALASLKTLETSSSSESLSSPPGPFGTTDSPEPPPLESKMREKGKENVLMLVFEINSLIGAHY